jgi:hypothetical protein
MRTPKRKIALVISAVIFWLAAPFVEAVFYAAEQSHGAYSVDSDSISIPIFQFFIGWLVFSPFVVLFVWRVLRSYPGSVQFFAFNRKRQFLAGLFWVATVVWLISSFVFGLQSVRAEHWTDVAYQLFGCYLALCFNGVLQADGRHLSAPNPIIRNAQEQR